MRCSSRSAAAATPAWCAKAPRAPRSAPSSTRPAALARLARRSRLRRRTATSLLLRRTHRCAGQEPRLDQRQPGHRRRSCARRPSTWSTSTASTPGRASRAPAAVRALLDAQAGVDAAPLATLYARWKAAADALERARSAPGRPRARARAPGLADRRARQARARRRRMGRAQRRAPAPVARAGADRRRARRARRACPKPTPAPTRWPAAPSTRSPPCRATTPRSAPVVEVLQGAQAQLEDAAHTLNALPRPHRARPRAPGRARRAPVGLDEPGAPLPPPAGRTAGAAGAVEGRARARSTPPPTSTRSSSAARRRPSAPTAHEAQRVSAPRAAGRAPRWPTP